MTSFGQFIRARRLALGFTQEDVEERSGGELSQNYISQAERDRIRRPSDAMLERFAAALGLSVTELKVARGDIVVESVGIERELVPVAFLGRVPADAVRWTLAEEEGRTLDVPARWLAGRPQEEFMILQASGDCLLSRGIRSGRAVLLRLREYARDPEPGDIVAVRVGDERSLKVWDRQGDDVLLRDGWGEVVYRMTPGGDELVVLGLYVTDWYEPELGELP